LACQRLPQRSGDLSKGRRPSPWCEPWLQCHIDLPSAYSAYRLAGQWTPHEPRYATEQARPLARAMCSPLWPPPGPAKHAPSPVCSVDQRQCSRSTFER
jgi:hypothetical protein